MRVQTSISLVLALALAGCGAHSTSTLTASPVALGTTTAALDAQKTQTPTPVADGPSVTLTPGGKAPTQPSTTAGAGGATAHGSVDPADDGNAIDQPEPGDPVVTVTSTVPAPVVDGPTVPGIASLMQTDSTGRAYTEVDPFDPVYLSPTQLPLIYPGSPATLPAYTARLVNTSGLPTDAVAELARLGRLRQKKAHILSWLFGYGYPPIDGGTAHAMLTAGTTIYLAPDASRFHFAKTYLAEPTEAPLDAMLPDLRSAALTGAQQAAREADIQDRMAILPAFNGTFDVLRLLYLDEVNTSYNLDGAPVHRGLVTAANLYTYASVRRAIATYWEDHPTATASDVRRASLQALDAKFQEIANEEGSIASLPTSYVDAQAIPGLRAPRAIDAATGDSELHDEDVRYNQQALAQLVGSAPTLLFETLYP